MRLLIAFWLLNSPIILKTQEFCTKLHKVKRKITISDEWFQNLFLELENEKSHHFAFLINIKAHTSHVQVPPRIHATIKVLKIHIARTKNGRKTWKTCNLQCQFLLIKHNIQGKYITKKLKQITRFVRLLCSQ